MSETPAREIKYTKWLRRGLLIALCLFALFFGAIISLAYFVLDSERGTQWSLQLTQRFLPNLSIVNADGTWQRGLRAQQIAWRNSKTDVEIDNIELKLQWPKLLHGEIHLPILHAHTLRVISKSPSDDKPITLPTIFLPSTLAVTDFTLQQLDIVNGDSIFTLHDLRSGVRWRGTTLELSRAHVRWDEIKLDATGTLGFRGDYPLRVQGQLTLPAASARNQTVAFQTINLQTTGDLRKLKLKAQSPAPLALKASVQLATLDKNLPLQMHVELSKPFVHTFNNDRIEIGKGNFDARGDLTQIEGTLALALTDSRYGVSKLDGTFLWRPEKLQTQLQWQPSSGNLQLQCDTALNKPISAICNGNAQTIALTPWLDGQNIMLSSTIKLDAKWLNPQWSLALALPDIKGQFNNDTITGNIDVRTDDGTQWQLQPSLLGIGPNEVRGNGQFGDHNHLQLAINASDLAHLDARAAGSITGTVSLEGDTTAPTIRAQLNANRLQFADMSARQARLDLIMPKLGNDSGRGRVDIQTLAIGKLAPFNLTFSISGTRSQQRWALNAQQNANRIALQCTTKSDSALDDWQLACPELSGRIVRNAINQDLRNTAALRGNAQLAKKQFQLAPFCLRGDDIELCLDQLLSYTDAKMQPAAAHASGIPLRWLQPWLPDDFNLINDARISAQVQLKSIAPLAAQASAEIPQTRWRWHTATGSETADINAIHLNATLDEKRAFMTTSAQSPTIGRIDAQLAINDPRQQRELDGHINIMQLQLAGLAWAFQGLDAVGGEINGDIGVTGTVSAPQLHGQLLLKDGSALWAPLGAPFRTVHADLTFDNNSAKLGGWFALGQGGGDIDGTMSWDGAGENWKLRLGLIAGGVSAILLPDSTVVFSPHAELNATPNELHIDGYVDIASADIRLKQLPPETINVSQDQEIIGQQIAEDAWKVWASIDLNLGDQFHLTGFGADVNLSGRLQLTQKPGDVLHMTGEVKVPRGRYRAYGQRLTVRKGSVIFYGPLDNADLNLEAVRDMPPGVTDVVGLRVIGSLKTPEALLFSEPSMPDSDIAYYLLTGRKPVAGTTGTSGYSASGALLSLGLSGSESRAGQLAQKFGITDLQLGTTENSSGQNEAEVSGQLGKDLYVRYGRGLGQQSNSISFQYRLTPKLMIETISGIEDALDLLYSFEIK